MRILNDEVLLRPGAHPAVLGVALSEPLDSGAPQVLAGDPLAQPQ
jgi:hypothetical protein